MALDPEDVPVLEGWVLLVDAANMMKLSPNGMRNRVFAYDEFGVDNVRKLTLGQNQIFLVRESKLMQEVAEELADREEYQTTQLPKLLRQKARRQQRKRIVAWAEQKQLVNPDFPIPVMGRLSNALLAAYVEDTGDTLIE